MPSRIAGIAKEIVIESPPVELGKLQSAEAWQTVARSDARRRGAASNSRLFELRGTRVAWVLKFSS